MANRTANNKSGTVGASQLRLLIVSPSSDYKTSPSPFPVFLRKLTGADPASDLSNFAGYTAHPPLHLQTKYYDTNITLWCDEIPSISVSDLSSSELSRKNVENNDPGTSITPHYTSLEKPQSNQETGQNPTLSEWKEQMLGDAAREVRDVIGGIVILLPHTQSATSASNVSDTIPKWSRYVEAVTTLRDTIEDESGRDVASLVVLQDITPSGSALASLVNDQTSKESTSLVDKVEEECLNNQGIMGWSYVAWTPGSESTSTTPSTDGQDRNEFGEKTGYPRIIEVLEGTDWTTSPSLDQDEGELEDMIGITTPANHGTSNDPSFNLNLHTPPPATATHLTSDNEFQREMLGLKMAMLEVAEPNSTPSSLAGEYDIGDFGMRTPLRQPRQPREARGSRLAGSPTGRGDDNDDDEQDTGNESLEGGVDETGEGDALKVEQLSRMMDRAVAVRETAEGMAPRERERFARREVNKIMKELG